MDTGSGLATPDGLVVKADGSLPRGYGFESPPIYTG